MNKFRVVVLGCDWDVYMYAFKDFIDNDKIEYIPTFRPSGLCGTLQRIHFNPKLNRIINIPLKNLWNPTYIKGVDKKENVCFLVFEHWLRMESSIKLLPYIRRNYPNAKIVCFLQDLVDRIIDHYTKRKIDVGNIRKYVDLFLSYDKEDTERYNLVYFPTVYSRLNVQKANTEMYDLYFLGTDKGRLQSLISISAEAEKRHLKCNFIVMGVPPEKQVKVNGITYISDQLSYKENLEYAASSRCLIEMLQPNALSPTFRTWEAISMNKFLLTSNHQITELPFYDKRYISIFKDVNSFDWDFVERARTIDLDLSSYVDSISPYKLLDFIGKKLGIDTIY